MRAYPGYGGWQSTNARKEHECVRGCKIKRGDVYFRMPLGGGWGNELKACAGCIAMILYFQGIHKLTEDVFHTHWSLEKETPVRVDDSTRDG